MQNRSNRGGSFFRGLSRSLQKGRGHGRSTYHNRDQTDVIPHSSEVESSANLSTDVTITQELLISSSSDSFSKLLGFLPRNGLYRAARQNLDSTEEIKNEEDDDEEEEEEQELEEDLDVDEYEEEELDEKNEVIEYDYGDEIGQDKDSNSEILDNQTLPEKDFDADDSKSNDDDTFLDDNTSNDDPFLHRFSGSTVVTQLIDNVSAEAILKASRSLTSIDISPSILTVHSIGANSELQCGSLLQGGAVKVSISESIGSAADEMNDVISRLKSSKRSADKKFSPFSTPFVDLSSKSGGFVKKSLVRAWQATYGSEPSTTLSLNTKHLSTIPSEHQNLTPLQYSLWKPLSSYRDIIFNLRTFDNARELRTLSALHVANHLLKARKVVNGHDRLIKEALMKVEEAKREKVLQKDALKQGKKDHIKDSLLLEEEGNSGASSGHLKSTTSAEPVVTVPEFRDQGFSRPRVLILLPHRHSALLFVRSLLRVLTEGSERQVANRKRFFTEFSETCEDDVDGEDDEDKDTLPTERDGMKAVLSKVPQVVREMMSDDESNYLDTAKDSVTPSYPFSSLRQGWPKHLKKKLEHACFVQRQALQNNSGSDDDDNDDLDKEMRFNKHRRMGAGGGRGKKRHKADRTERALSKMQNESILSSTALYNASLAKMEKAREQKLRKKEREKQYSLLNPIPNDFQKTFLGNIDDDFRLGVSLSNRQVKLFAPFYDSDLIVASPLGLRRVMGGEGEENREIDFLSSIEVVIMDEADLLLQQNWQHVKDIFSALNVTPLSPQHTDFSRVRESDLSGLLRFNRQTVIFSSYPDAEISSLVKKNCFNALGGQVVIRASVYKGSMSRVISTIRQSFFALTTGLQPKSSLQTVADADDARIEAFKSLVLPLLKPRGKGEEKTAQQPHTLIFIPSYFDYVRLRNLLDVEDVEFSTCSEYSDDKDIAISRKSFRRGDSVAILVTERFHFFRRVRFFGVKHVVFYGPPRIANSYPEVLNWVEERSFGGIEGRGVESETANTSLLLYSKFDGLQLERICGSEKASKMLLETRKGLK
jgi:hypothetical protein